MFQLIDHNRDNTREFETRAEAEEQQNDLISLGAEPSDLEITKVSSDGGDASDITTEPTGESYSKQSASVNEGDVKVVDHTEEDITNPEDLSTDPIGFLESVNSDFVNTIKGTPAISKQGFRFIQREFEISTESKVVEWIDDPLGCVVWAKAERPNGYSAEAHGEGYQFESDVSDNEFVRYADTRAKNRAISDLTSAGALAVSEMQGEP